MELLGRCLKSGNMEEYSSQWRAYENSFVGLKPLALGQSECLTNATKNNNSLFVYIVFIVIFWLWLIFELLKPKHKPGIFIVF